MNGNIKQANNEKKEFDGINIMQLTVKTFFYTVVGLVFTLALFVLLFPYPTISFYSSLGLTQRAYESAKSYVKINDGKYIDVSPDFDSKYADALLFCVNTSITNLNHTIVNDKTSVNTQKIAKEADKYIEKFLNYDLEERIKVIDDYAIKNTVPSLRPFVYSYKSDIECAQIKAKACIPYSNVEQILLDRFSELKSIGQDGFTIDDFVNTSHFLNLISAYIEVHLPLERGSLFVSRDGLLPFYDEIENMVAKNAENARDYIIAYDAGTDPNLFLKKLYCFKSVSKLIENFKEFFAPIPSFHGLTGQAEKLEFWTDQSKMPASVIENKTMGEYFMYTLLNQYTQMQKK